QCFYPVTAVSYLLFYLLFAPAIAEVFFFKFYKVPITCSYASSKFQLVAVAAAYLYAFTTYVLIATNLKRVVTAAPFRMIVFLCVSAVVFTALRKWRRSVSFTHDENEAALLSWS